MSPARAAPSEAEHIAASVGPAPAPPAAGRDRRAADWIAVTRARARDFRWPVSLGMDRWRMNVSLRRGTVFALPLVFGCHAPQSSTDAPAPGTDAGSPSPDGGSADGGGFVTDAGADGEAGSPAPSGRWLGADTGSGTIASLKALTGAELRVHLRFCDWVDSWGNMFSFTAAAITADAADGVATMMTWSPNDTIPNVLSGKYDAYLHQWAKDAKTDGRRFLLRMAHEANGNWYAWSYAGSVPASKYADMWRHVHDIFTAEGATNVRWVFCPNAVGPGIADFTNAYPGDAYVDYVGLDSYNFDSGGNWLTFSQLFQPSYALMEKLTSKPLILCETASVEDPKDAPHKAQWITDAFETAIPSSMPNVIGVTWFDETGPPDWRVNTSAASLAAFQAVAADTKWQAPFPGFP
jgi:endoglucanase